MSITEDISPIRRQYLDIKRQYPDAILFFRLGDFYETFDQDAETTSRELDIVLTSRNVAKDSRVPMAGIPHHAAESYLARLIERGYHVAICEQVGDQPQKGIFPRQVVRVVTPGTVTEPGLVPSDANNYLVSIFVQDEGAEQVAGLALVDITTGEFAATEFRGEDITTALRSELTRIRPAEILYPDSQSLTDGLTGHRTKWPAWRFEAGRCQQELMRHFGVTTLAGFGLHEQSASIRAAGAIIQYLAETQPSSLKLLIGISTYSLTDFMILDTATRRNLELTETIRSGSVKEFFIGHTGSNDYANGQATHPPMGDQTAFRRHRYTPTAGSGRVILH